ncbi:MAG: acetyl-CoA carboxylase biotin carboxyl carrier protein, partial [Gammaproteobacteria bacterium]|nr:acetyl-CoA carboxylase biotin carboxyl carrier protein [Gammaproteobacteria bacterium]
MDIRKVKKLIELLDESGIAEIEITEGEESVRISRYAAGTPVAAAPVVAHAPAAVAHAVPVAAPEAPAPAEAPDEDGFEVTAPMVGTFYAAASPGAAPYVQVGDRVN